jgi:acyl-CoA thioester hydrolase
MSRTKLELPSQFLFSTELVVRISDINYGGHLGNDAVLSLIHEARVRFLNHLGYSEKNVEGVGIIMVDAVIVYKGEGFHGDRLTIEVGVGEFWNTGCEIFYRLTNARTLKELARAKTAIAFYDYEHQKTMSVPARFKSKVQGNNPVHL